jgi:putative transcriptional regulator
MIPHGKGILLIAEPFLNDPSFVRSVVVLCEHNEEGSFGLVINNKLDMELGDFFPEFEDFKIPLYQGGPVEIDSLHFLHQYPDLIPDSIMISDGVYRGGNFETVRTLINSEAIDLDKIRFYVGYSGWDPDQLDEEVILENSWLTTEATPALVFLQNTNDIWKESIKKLGGKYEMMINFPKDPQLN